MSKRTCRASSEDSDAGLEFRDEDQAGGTSWGINTQTALEAFETSEVTSEAEGCPRTEPRDAPTQRRKWQAHRSRGHGEEGRPRDAWHPRNQAEEAWQVISCVPCCWWVKCDEDREMTPIGKAGVTRVT